MTTIRQIITDAFRESGLIQTGLTPEAEEFDEALRKLQGVIYSLYGNEMGSPLTTITYGDSGLTNEFAQVLDVSANVDSVYVPTNLRVVMNIASPTYLYLDPNPEDGSRFAIIDSIGNFGTNNVTVSGNGRLIGGQAAITLSTNSTKREWFYRADLGSWTEITDLTASSESPFPVEFDEYLTLLLAIRLNPRYQVQTAQETAGALQRMSKQFKARYKQIVTMSVEDALIRMSSRPYYSSDPILSGFMFKRGWIF